MARVLTKNDNTEVYFSHSDHNHARSEYKF